MTRAADPSNDASRTMNESTQPSLQPSVPAGLDLLETGVPRLDDILGGGLPRGGLALVVGAPGTGKTTLAQQTAFHHASRDGMVLFLTGFSETNEKLLTLGRTLTFFDP